ncbi:MAG TPA: lipoate--protein ligase [Clostridium sp.]|uniref:lipoate--protein ligase n=1 Tax=Clostridium sp. TaxID=1506 RepID=UPI002F94A59C
MKYVENNSIDPRYNLALEEYAFKNFDLKDDYVILWRNGPSIIIGRNQCTPEEINSQYVSENNIGVVRRITGGGAVYHDLGNLNFSFITKVSRLESINFKKYTYPVINALGKLGVKCELSGRNDLTLDGKKFSGIAQSIISGRLLNHGTLLFNSQLDTLGKALNVKKEKIESKGIKSVRSRVTNISDYLKADLDVLGFRDLILKYLYEYEKSPIIKYELTKEDKDAINKLMQEKYNTWQWNFGKSPKFNYKNSRKFDIGILDVRINVEDGLIKNCKMYGDFFGTEDIKKFEEVLIGIRFQKNDISNIIKYIDITRYFGKISKEDLLSLFFETDTIINSYSSYEMVR